MQKILLFFLQFLIFTLVGQVPTIIGNVNVSLSKGSFIADVQLEGLPLQSHHTIFLNKGLKIKEALLNGQIITITRDTNDLVYEAWMYHLPENITIKNNSTLRIKYDGQYEVVNHLDKAKETGDWKGNMAFNGNSFRASEQSMWYPIVYDINSNFAFDHLAYRLNIECPECDLLYLTGNPPTKGQSQSLHSDEAYSLFLYLTKGNFSKVNDTYFINSGLHHKEEKIIVQWTDSIKTYLSKNLNLPYGHNLTYVSTAPVTKNNAWMFFTYPAIAIIGHEKYNLRSYFDGKAQLKNDQLVNFLSHELGHYYFGHTFSPDGVMKWAFLEGITEYMSLLSTRSLLGEKKYEEKLMHYIKESIDLEILALNEMKAKDYNETFRYSYFPLLLTTMEKKIGEDRMWKWMQFVLKNHPTNNQVDYAYFRQSFIDSGVSESEFRHVEMICYKASNSKENVIKIIERGFKH